MGDMKWSWNLWHQDKPVKINIGWRTKIEKETREKERNINSRKKGKWRKRKGRKDKVDGKEVEKQGV